MSAEKYKAPAPAKTPTTAATPGAVNTPPPDASIDPNTGLPRANPNNPNVNPNLPPGKH